MTTLEVFYLSLRDGYLEENDRQKLLEDKAHKFLLISSIIVTALQFLKLDYGWIVLIPIPIILLFYILIMRIKSYDKPLKVDHFLTQNDEICENILDKTKKLSKDAFLNDRIESYIRCTSGNKKINQTKARFIEWMQSAFIIQIILLVGIYCFSII